MGQITHRSRQHAQILLGNAGETLQTKGIRGRHDTLTVQKRPIDIEELATRHLTVIGHRRQGVDVLVDDVDVLGELILGLGLANETLRKLGQRELLAEMGRQEQHEPQPAVDFAAGLE